MESGKCTQRGFRKKLNSSVHKNKLIKKKRSTLIVNSKKLLIKCTNQIEQQNFNKNLKNKTQMTAINEGKWEGERGVVAGIAAYERKIGRIYLDLKK